jgi:hypothetical protein
MRIICAGPPRSGSTWQFNAVRMLIAETGQSCYGAWIEDYDQTRSEAVHIVKTHDVIPMTGTVVTCYRDIRDVVASARRMGWLSGRRAEVDAYLQNYTARLSTWSAQAVHVMRYETMKADPPAEAVRLARALGLELSSAQIENACRRVSELTPPQSGPYDSVTMLHARHIGSREQKLPARLRRKIDEKFGLWLRQHGYDVEPPASWIERIMRRIRG